MAQVAQAARSDLVEPGGTALSPIDTSPGSDNVNRKQTGTQAMLKYLLLGLMAFACPVSVAAQTELWQTNEDAAFAEARRRIAEEVWDLSFQNLTALRTLPPEIAGFTGLLELDLTSTGVTDLAPLAGLTGLQCLVLGPDDDIDPSPLAGLPEMKTVQSLEDC